MCIGQERTAPEVARRRWLEERQQGIGGSDAPAAVGVSPYKSTYALWAEKTGLAPPPELDLDVEEDDDPNELMEWGLEMEPVILGLYRKRTGREVDEPRRYTIVRHRSIPWIFATPDATQYDGRRGHGLVQVKNVNDHAFRKRWADGPPLHVQVQVQHELLASGLRWGTIVAGVGGNRLAWFDVEPNPAFVDALLLAEARFWAMVRERRPPDPDASESTRLAIARAWPRDDGSTVALPAEADAWDARLVKVKRLAERVHAIQAGLENRIKSAMGAASVGVTPSGVAYTYRTVTVNHKPREAYRSTHRRLQRKGTH